MFLRRSTTACGLLLAIGLVSATAAVGAPRAARQQGKATTWHVTATLYAREIEKLRSETWYWQRVMGVRTSPVRVRMLAASSVARMRRLDELWRKRERNASRAAHNPPQLRAWLCIHRYEGSWHDPGAPYYGGLQMDYAFQQTYGRWLLAAEGDGRPLVAAGADLDGGARPPRPRLHAVAEHGARLRPRLNFPLRPLRAGKRAAHACPALRFPLAPHGPAEPGPRVLDRSVGEPRPHMSRATSRFARFALDRRPTPRRRRQVDVVLLPQ